MMITSLIFTVRDSGSGVSFDLAMFQKLGLRHQHTSTSWAGSFDSPIEISLASTRILLLHALVLLSPGSRAEISIADTRSHSFHHFSISSFPNLSSD
jgi:hypothetical protein